MNIAEIIVCITLFSIAIILLLYIGQITVSLLSEKYVFEATRHANCFTNSTEGNIVVTSCIRVIYNGTFIVAVYNITRAYPYAS